MDDNDGIVSRGFNVISFHDGDRDASSQKIRSRTKE
jgi:hypothetical protein